MAFDLDLLLTAETLSLNPDLTRGETVNDTFTYKVPASGKNLTVDTAQACILAKFAQPTTVPTVLESCIRERLCPALREFYALIVNAHEAGVLRAEFAPPPTPHPAFRWVVSVPTKLVKAIAAVSLLAVIFTAALRAPVMPTSWLDWVIGVLAVCGGLSVGSLFAATTLRGAGCEVYDPGLRYHLGFLPHFGIDLRDACMPSLGKRIAIHASTVVPLLLASAAGLWWKQGWTLLPFAVALLALRPVGPSVANRLIELCRRQPLRSTDRVTYSEAELPVREILALEWRRFDGRCALLQLLLAIMWVAAIVFLGSRLLHANPWPRLLDRELWRRSAWTVGLSVPTMLVFWLAALVQHRVVHVTKERWKYWRRHLQRWTSPDEPLRDPEKIAALVRRNPLLSRLDYESQLEVIAQLKPFAVGPWKKVFAFDEEPPFAILIASGEIAVYRRNKAGRRARFLRLIEGDLFGGHTLVDPEGPGLEVRSKTPFRAMILPNEDFARLVIDRLGKASVRSYLQRQLFLLRGSDLCAEWRPAAVSRFAELVAASNQHATGKIVFQGQQVINVYVLYEGRARALRGKKQVGTLKAGDVFGEISVLQSSVATADVEVKDEARLLLINRVDFIRFLSRNHAVALTVERLCSRRLGCPIFPLNGSFEAG